MPFPLLSKCIKCEGSCTEFTFELVHPKLLQLQWHDTLVLREVGILRTIDPDCSVICQKQQLTAVYLILLLFWHLLHILVAIHLCVLLVPHNLTKWLWSAQYCWVSYCISGPKSRVILGFSVTTGDFSPAQFIVSIHISLASPEYHCIGPSNLYIVSTSTKRILQSHTIICGMNDCTVQSSVSQTEATKAKHHHPDLPLLKEN